jgi:hypothetical protein
MKNYSHAFGSIGNIQNSYVGPHFVEITCFSVHGVIMSGFSRPYDGQKCISNSQEIKVQPHLLKEKKNLFL